MEYNCYENNWKLAKTHESKGILEKTQGILKNSKKNWWPHISLVFFHPNVAIRTMCTPIVEFFK